jgi:hypothetical protein
VEFFLPLRLAQPKTSIFSNDLHAMKVLLLALFFLGLPFAQAAEYFEWDNPTTPFDARKRNFNVVQVEWRTVDNVFNYCSNLARVDVDNSNQSYASTKQQVTYKLYMQSLLLVEHIMLFL